MSYASLPPPNLTNGNGTAPLEEPNTVSWQSAFWPVAACTTALMFQNAGRVCGAPYRFSYALRASPVVCALDSLIMIVKFSWMLVLGCSIKTAVRHVWYDRFLLDDSLPDDYRDIFPEDGMKAAYSEIQESHTRLPSITVGSDVTYFQGEESGQIDAGQYVMSGALPPPIPSRPPVGMSSDGLDNAGILYGDEDIADVALELTTIEEVSGNRGGSTNVSANSPESTEPLTNHDVESAMSVIDHSPLFGATQYSNNHPGTNIDRTWRLTMAGFLVGALPQAIKILGMQGIPWTQVMVGVQVSSFVVPEIFRSTAGAVGALELRPMPSIEFAKEALQSGQLLALIIAGVCNLAWCEVSLALGFGESTSSPFGNVIRLLFIDLFFIAPVAAVLLFCSRTRFIQLSTIKCLMGTITPPHIVKKVQRKMVVALQGVIAVRTSHDSVLYLCYFLAVPITAVPLICLFALYDKGPTNPSFFEIGAIFIYLFSFPVAIHAAFRVLFMGSLSKGPRALFGLKGTWGEYLRFLFIGLHTLSLFSNYAGGSAFYNPIGTYKPHWADMLG